MTPWKTSPEPEKKNQGYANPFSGGPNESCGELHDQVRFHYSGFADNAESLRDKLGMGQHGSMFCHQSLTVKFSFCFFLVVGSRLHTNSTSQRSIFFSQSPWGGGASVYKNFLPHELPCTRFFMFTTSPMYKKRRKGFCRSIGEIRTLGMLTGRESWKVLIGT